ncbi:MAG: NAD-dependent epimerase/dehydratase family protein [Chitinophagales bacterium]|nr:NAD-dependent epimerase/dehydratase family protein [Chitinophagales bacterium]
MQNILITGSGGYIGSQFLLKCIENKQQFNKIVALDIRTPKEEDKIAEVIYVEADIRSEKIHEIVAEYKITTIVHLAAIISITGHNSASFEYDVDVNGSHNIINAAIKNKVKRFIYSSSGAAYGYWPSNVDLVLTEDMKMLGNKDIPYSYHKYLVEERLKAVRKSHPEMEQFVFRVGTILGENTKNPITDYLKKPKLLCIKGYPSAFVAIWDKDLVNILFKATQDGKSGIYNVAGTGSIPTQELATFLGKPAQVLPVWLLKLAFAVLRPLRLIPYGPESLKFIQYRPVLSNEKLKTEFAYTPEKTTKEVFEFWKKYNL